MTRSILPAIMLVAISISCGQNSVISHSAKQFNVKPNATLELYVQKYPNFCASGFSEDEIWKSVKNFKGDSNRKAEYNLRLGLCYARHGKQDLAALYMYRVAALSDLVTTDGSAKRTALSFMQERGSGSLVDFGWANQTMLNESIPSFSPLSEYGAESRQAEILLRGTQSRNRMNLKVFESEFLSGRGK